MKHKKPCRTAQDLFRRRGTVLVAGAAGALALLAQMLAPAPAAARDTGAYTVISGQNAYMLLDGSGSMGGTVYEHSIDYGKLYDRLMSASGEELKRWLNEAKTHPMANKNKVSNWANQCADNGCYVEDSKSANSGLPGTGGQKGYLRRHFEKDHLYLIDRNSAIRISRNAKRRDGSAVPPDSQHPDDFSDKAPDWYYGYGFTNMWNQLDPNKLYNGGSPASSLWMADTNTALRDGKLVKEVLGRAAAEQHSGTEQRLTVGDVVVSMGAGETVTLKDIVLLDGKPMPMSQMTPLHKYQELKLASREGEITRGAPKLDSGLAGALTAPGYYGIGFNKDYWKPGTMRPLTIANGVGRTINQATWYLVTGNYLNYLQHLNLELHKSNGAILSSANTSGNYFYAETWLAGALPYPAPADEWPALDYELSFPSGGANYASNIDEKVSARAVMVPGAKRVQLRFKYLDLGEGDELAVYDGEGSTATKLAVYTRENNTVQGDGSHKPFWSDSLTVREDDTMGTFVLRLKDNGDDSVGRGYSIDCIRSTEQVVNIPDPDDAGKTVERGSYVLMSRQRVAREAMLTILDLERFKDVNWGFAQYNAGVGIAGLLPINPNVAPETQRQKMRNSLRGYWVSGSTPTMMALQELWLKGFYNNQANLKDEQCNASVIINVTDGFPNTDRDNCKFRTAGLPFPVSPVGAVHPSATGCFQDWDGDELISDTSDFNFYDDISQWMYEHSWEDGQPTDEATRRVTVHNIAFGARMTLLKNASEQTPGSIYANAGNKSQLIAALTAMAGTTGSGASFSAPAISSEASSLDSGKDAYSGLFLPRSDAPWAGNIKWYKRGNRDGEDTLSFYGKDYVKATDSDGKLQTVDDWWATGESNDAYAATNSDIVKGGVGQLLLDAVQKHLAAAKNSGRLEDYYQRRIYTCKPTADDNMGDCDELVEFSRAFRKDRDLGKDFDMDLVARYLDVTSQAEANNIINYTYGYSKDYNTDTGAPTSVRDWVLGAIVHSQPLIIDYYAYDQIDEPYHRLIAVGANDGMLHIFEGESGEEIFAFVPPDVLHKLKDMPTEGTYVDSVDGELSLYRQGDPPRQPKYLLFGLRNGGNSYWSLDISMENGVLWKDNPWEPLNSNGALRWKVAWNFRHSEIISSWSKVQTARIPIGFRDGKRTYKDVAIFAGGYDPIEENFPEPFDDYAGEDIGQEKTGTPFGPDGNIIPSKWTANGEYDINQNGEYDIWNAAGNASGRSFFVVDIEDPDQVTKANYDKYNPASDSYSEVSEVVLPFSVIYGDVGGKTVNDAGVVWTRSDMKWCFPATPSAAVYTDAFFDKEKGDVETRTGILSMIYAPDIYGNLFKARYNAAFVNIGTQANPVWKFRGEGWEVRKIFSANPGTGPESGKSTGDTSTRAGMEGSSVSNDVGRKVFYAPTISFGGNRDFFEAANFADYMLDDDVKRLQGRDGIASVFFGTGDREHPTYTMVHNRVYGIYDDSSMYAVKDTGAIHDISSINLNLKEKTYTEYGAYDERDLLNLTCDELGTEFSQSNHITGGGDFSSWLRSVYGDDKSVSDVVNELVSGGEDLSDWLEEWKPWKYTCNENDSVERCDEKRALLVTDRQSTSLARDYLAKQYLGAYLTDDALDAYDERSAGLEVGGERTASGVMRGTENDRKGWYIKLDRQATSDCNHMQTAHSVDTEGRDNHRGEAVLAPLTLYYGVLYFTSFQTAPGDACSTNGGDAFTYAIDYGTGRAPYNYNSSGGDIDYTDRYFKYTNVVGLPSAVTFIFEGDQVVPVAQLGDRLVGFAEPCPPGETCNADSLPTGGVAGPSPGLDLYYWRDSNSQEGKE